MTIPTNDTATSPFTFQVQGTAFAAPAMSLSGNTKPIASGDARPAPTGTDFGSAKTNVGTVVKTFTIKNTGSDVLNFNGSPVVSLSGDAAADFAVTTDAASDPLNPGDTTTFTLTFTPTANAGTVENAVATINSNDPAGAFTLNLKGTATA